MGLISVAAPSGPSQPSGINLRYVSDSLSIHLFVKVVIRGRHVKPSAWVSLISQFIPCANHVSSFRYLSFEGEGDARLSKGWPIAFRIRGLRRERMIIDMSTKAIELEKRKVISPPPISIALRKLDSAMGPRITASTVGARGKFIRSIHQPNRPKRNISQTSNILLLIT